MISSGLPAATASAARTSIRDLLWHYTFGVMPALVAGIHVLP